MILTANFSGSIGTPVPAPNAMREVVPRSNKLSHALAHGHEFRVLCLLGKSFQHGNSRGCSRAASHGEHVFHVGVRKLADQYSDEEVDLRPYGIKLPELSEVLFSQWYAEFWRLDRLRVAHAFLSLSIRHDLTTARRRLPSLVASRACGRA